MAKLKLPAFNEGSLLKRTLLHVATFVLGSISFVLIGSLIVLWAAKAVLPAHGSSSADDSSEVAAATPGKSSGKSPRPRRGRSTPQPAEEPSAETTH